MVDVTVEIIPCGIALDSLTTAKFPDVADDCSVSPALSVENDALVIFSPEVKDRVRSRAISIVAPASRSKVGFHASFFCTVITIGSYPGIEPTAEPH